MTAADLAGYVSPDGLNSTKDQPFVESCWATAATLVAQHVGGDYIPGSGPGGGTVFAMDIPQAVLDRAVLEVGAELYNRRQAPNGLSQFATPNGQSAVRVARDPMVAAYPLLAPYVGRGVA